MFDSAKEWDSAVLTDVFVIGGAGDVLVCCKRGWISSPGHIPLEIIGIQNGSYTGEDDIVQYE